MFSVYQCVLAVVLVIDAANGLKCFNCNSQESLICESGFARFAFTIRECNNAGYFDNLVSSKCFRINALSRDGKEYVARGCLPPATNDCKAIARAAGWIVADLEKLNCKTCQTDKCNDD